MSRKKLKGLTFADYGITILASVLGTIALSFILRFSWGGIVYSIAFSLMLFVFIYSRGALAAKIDLRTNEASIKKALELAFPLAITLICITAIYSLFYYDILPAKNVVLTTAEASDGTSASLYLIEVIAVTVRVIFFNLTGFMKQTVVSPFILFISPAIIICSALLGYLCGMKKIYITDYIIKFKDLAVKKFNE